MLVLFFGGGWAAMGPTGRPGRAADLELDALCRRLDPKAVAHEKRTDTAAVASSLVRAARLEGLDPGELVGGALPPAHEILGMLSLDRDIDDFLDYATRDDTVGSYYREEARLSLEMRPLRDRYEAAFASAFTELSAPLVTSEGARGREKRRRPYVAEPEDVWLPPKGELPLSHPYALDVFFQHVDKSGEAEKGPLIRALYPGIVVAAALDWSGGQGLANYKSGGLSPAAGNGLVIYDPASRRYCSYFHLSSAIPRVGSIVEAGEPIGRGGNSGMNARKKGHGEHLHIEIFDAAQDAPLSSYQILELLRK
jgi:hypothetical protein